MNGNEDPGGIKMKKLFAMLLVIAMLLGSVAVAEVAVDYTGTWVVTGAEIEGVRMSPSMLSVMGVDIAVTFNADGTAVLIASGAEAVGNWTATETGVSLAESSGVTDVFVYRDEMLVIRQDGMAMMFTREGAAPAVAEESAVTVLANVDPKEFEGWWMLTKVSAMGMEIPAESVGSIALKLSEGGGVVMFREGEGELENAPVTYVTSEVEGVGTVAVVSMVNAEAGLAVEVLRLSLRSDGTLVQETVEEGMNVSLIFTCIAE